MATNDHVSFVTRILLQCIIYKNDAQAKHYARQSGIDLKQFKNEHSEEILFALLKK